MIFRYSASYIDSDGNSGVSEGLGVEELPFLLLPFLSLRSGSTEDFVEDDFFSELRFFFLSRLPEGEEGAALVDFKSSGGLSATEDAEGG